MKGMALLFCLLIASSMVGAVKVEKLDIALNVDNAGKAGVRENYYLQFTSPFESDEFNKKAEENASSILAWQVDYDFFFPHFGGSAGNTLEASTITYDKDGKLLTLAYSLKGSFATLKSQEQRNDVYLIDDARFGAFNEAGSIVIPENTAITITVPENTQILRESLPAKVIVNGNSIVLRGLQSNSLSITYNLLKPIAPRSDDIVQGISNIYILAPIALVLGLIVYARKETLEKRIEDYLVEHSEIKNREAEQEIEIDFDKK